MKKNQMGVILLVVCALLVVGGGAAFFYMQSMMEKQVQSSVEQLLQKYDIKHTGVSYKASDDVLVITGLSYTVQELPGTVVHVGELVISEPNMDALDPNVSGRPLVAKAVVFKNMHGNYTFMGMEKEFTLERTEISGWKQNLGKVLALHGEGYSEAYFTAFMDLTVERIVSTNYSEKGVVVVDGDRFEVAASIGSTQLTDISSTLIGNYSVDKVSVQLYEAQGDDNLVVDVKKFSWDTIAMPSPRYWASFMEMLPKILDKSITAEELAVLAQHGGGSRNLFDSTQMALEGLTTVLRGKSHSVELFAVQKANVSSSLNAEKHSLADLHVDVQGMGVHNYVEQLLPMLDMLFKTSAGNTLVVDTSLDIDVAADRKTTLALSFGVQNLGMSRVHLELIVPQYFLSYALGTGEAADETDVSSADYDKWLEASMLAALELHYEDQGLLPKALVLLSKESNVPAPDLLKMIEADVMKNARDVFPVLAEENFTALQQCLEHPGTANFVMKPAQPVPVMTAVLNMMVAPTTLNAGLTCVPGKSILERAQELQSAQ